ncbi:MAG TPA: ABC transporter substrate-binding protein [Actinomycetota bacterium]
MKMTRKSVAIAISIVMVGGLALSGNAMAQDATETPADEKVTLNVGLDSDVTSLNPYNLCCGPDYEYLGLVYDISMDWSREDLTAAPGFVQSWTPNADSTEWTLKIAEGATWHDGEPVTAEDVAFSFQLVADNAMPFYKDYLPFEPTFEVVDDTTVLWTSKEPTFAPEVPAYIPIVPEHIWGEFVVEDDPSATRKAVKEFANEEAVGSGPFILDEYIKGQFMRLEANPDYWGPKPASLDEIVFTFYQSQEAMVQALKSGEIDYAYGLNPSLYNSLKGEANIAQRAGDGGCWGNFAWNFGGQGPKANADPTIHDLTFRQAVATGIDRQEIIDKVYQGTATMGYSVLMPGRNGSWYADIPQELRFDYDAAAANTMLDEAGYTDTDGDGIRNGEEGENLDLELLVISDVNGSVDTGKLLQGYLSDMQIDSFLTTVNTTKAYDLWAIGQYDAYVWDWCPDPDPDFMMSVFTTEQCLGWSDGCYSNPAYDELYDLQQTQLDRADREATIDEMQLMLAEEIPTMVLNYWSDLSAYRTDRFDPATWSRTPNNDAGVYLFGATLDSYFTLEPLSDAAASSSSPGLPAWIWIVGIGAVAVIGVGIVLARRKGPDEDDA